MRYVCQICGYVYDDAAEKVPFSDLPDTWKCPLCGAAKSDFKPEAAQQEAAKPAVQRDQEAELTGLSAGQLAALCSNLARGCEKQYKAEEAGLFRELADYFSAIVPPVNDASVQKVAALLQEDVDNYGSVRDVADAVADRGAARSRHGNLKKSRGGSDEENGCGQKPASVHQRLSVPLCLSVRSDGYGEQYHRCGKMHRLRRLRRRLPERSHQYGAGRISRTAAEGGLRPRRVECAGRE